MATSSDKQYGVLVLLPLSIMVAAVMMARVSEAATIEIKNQCPYTVWPAAIPGGGTRLDRGQSWRIQVAAGTAAARIWGRTGCNFDSSGRGHCVTGDCGGLLRCTGSGAVPSTLVEYSLNQFSNKDFYDISLVDGFNIPVSIVPLKGGCRTVTCLPDINSKCPSELKVRDGCKSACVAFNTPQYCCTGQYLNNCPPTDYSRFFKRQCPQAYSYAKDDPSSTFTCAGGGDYKVVFCGTSLGSSGVYNTTSSLVESQ